MLASNIPVKVPLPFANSGTKNAIPTASQIGIIAGKASLTDGFPPLTFTPLASGGVPPAGADFNGILNLLSANTQWANAGGAAKYDATFSTAIGGYPKGANLVKATNDGYWLNTVDGNTTNPDTGGAGWDQFVSLAQFSTSGTGSGYQKLPGGLIIQWGIATSNASGLASVTYPIAFPSLVFNVMVSEANTVSGVVTSGSSTLSGFPLNYFTSTGSAASSGVTAFWIALGK